MMTRKDTLSDIPSLSQMSYVEFIAFIARISHYAYRDKDAEGYDIGLHLKIYRVLGPLLGTI